MKDAIITIITQETYDDVTYPVTEVWRVEFEGDAKLFESSTATEDVFGLFKVVAAERLVAKP